MYCSPSEIERKRQEALARLAKKKFQQSPVKTDNFPFENGQVSSTSPRFKFQSKNSPNRPNLQGTSYHNVHNKKPYDKPISLAQNENGKGTQNLQIAKVDFYGKDKVLTAKIELCSETMFSVVLSSFSTQAVDVFKTIPSRYYDPKTKAWSFNLKDYTLLVSKFRNSLPHIALETLPNFVVSCLKSAPKITEIDYNRLDPVVLSSLLPFQEEGVRFAIEKNGRCLIADDMGLGKTIQALAVADYYKEDWPLLIVTTASMRNVWEEHIHKFLPSVFVTQIQYMTSGRDYIGDSKILITSHDLMSRCVEKLIDRNFGVMIVDESHLLKNYKTKICKCATELAKKAKRVVLLSGTPALSRPSELFSQLNLLDSRFFGNFFEFSRRYCDGKTTNFGWDASGQSNLKELEIVLSKKFMIRRTKADVIKSLPNKQQEVVELDVHLEQFSDVDRLCLNAIAQKYDNQNNKAQRHTILITYFAETAKIKIPSVCSYILQILESKQKFLVFAHHQVMLNAIEDVLKRKTIKYIRIDGTTTCEQRKFFVDKFQQDPDTQCAILSITAANAGLTLTAANLVIFAELHWNPSILSQAEARAHRIGQGNTVNVHYLLGKGTADVVMWSMIQEKQKILSEVGLCTDSFNDVQFKKQDSNKLETVTDGLNISIVTKANTLDITSYFKTPEKGDNSISNAGNSDNSADDISGVFDDGLDDILSNIDI